MSSLWLECWLFKGRPFAWSLILPLLMWQVLCLVLEDCSAIVLNFLSHFLSGLTSSYSPARIFSSGQANCFSLPLTHSYTMSAPMSGTLVLLSFDKCFLCPCDVPNMILGTKDTAASKTVSSLLEIPIEGSFETLFQVFILWSSLLMNHICFTVLGSFLICLIWSN